MSPISTPQGQGFDYYPRWPVAFDKIHCTCFDGNLGFIFTFKRGIALVLRKFTTYKDLRRLIVVKG